jgi:hypothetical protein
MTTHAAAVAGVDLEGASLRSANQPQEPLLKGESPSRDAYRFVILRRGKKRALLLAPGGALFRSRDAMDEALSAQFAQGWKDAEVHFYYADTKHGTPVIFADSQPAPVVENARGQYAGTDWSTAMERNVTVSLEYAEHDIVTGNITARTLGLVREALRECRRLLAAQPVPA